MPLATFRQRGPLRCNGFVRILYWYLVPTYTTVLFITTKAALAWREKSSRQTFVRLWFYLWHDDGSYLETRDSVGRITKMYLWNSFYIRSVVC
jgi:hypothetical protein